MSRRAAGLAAVVLAVVLTGCGGGAPPAEPPPSVPAPVAPPAGDPDAAACQRHETSADGVRKVIGAIDAGPVLPAGVALFLLAPRDRYAAAGTRDAPLAAAMAEVVAAMDDLDAQGKAGLPAGGDATKNTVKLDSSRMVAALAEVDRLCRPGT